jgi:glucan phosphoethanolaminetransferase (alkaline phosphatase superfamily)
MAINLLKPILVIVSCVAGLVLLATAVLYSLIVAHFVPGLGFGGAIYRVWDEGRFAVRGSPLLWVITLLLFLFFYSLGLVRRIRLRLGEWWQRWMLVVAVLSLAFAVVATIVAPWYASYGAKPEDVFPRPIADWLAR